jgi:hypothetical protein
MQLGQVLQEQQLTSESQYSPRYGSFEVPVPTQLLSIALTAFEGKIMGMTEAKDVLLLASGLLALPSQAQAFFEGGGLQHLMLLLTHPDSKSTLQLTVLSTMHALLGHPAQARHFFDDDCSNGQELKMVWSQSLNKKSKEPSKKLKTEEETPKTAYQILLGLLAQGKPPAKVAQSLKTLANRSSFYLQLEALNGTLADLPQLESLKKQLKLQLLQSSSRCLHTVKHELQASLLQLTVDDFLDAMRLTSHPLLTNSTAAWLSHTNFLGKLYSYLEATDGLSSAEFRTVFVAVADCLVSLLRSRGGQHFLACHEEAVLKIVSLLDSFTVQAASEPADLSLLEEENLLTVVQAERLNAYISQLARILRMALKLESILDDLPALFEFAGADEELARQVVYLHFRLQPQALIKLFSEASLKTPQCSVMTFYLFELLLICKL